MATGNVFVTVVDVGQGQSTFVEIYDDSSTPKLIHALLFDCGSDKESDETETNLEYIAARVGSMTTPAFDSIFFSHSDKDHIYLTYKLLAKFPSSSKPAVKQVWYGGDREKYTKYGYNILNYLVADGYCANTDIKTTGSNYTGYDETSKAFAENLWMSTDKSVVVYAVASNALSDNPDWDDNNLDVEGKTAEALNRVSMICGLYYAGVSCVICGDATNITMSAVNNLFSGGTTVFNNNLMLTTPHHGSRATGFAVASGKTASFAASMVVYTFSQLIKAKTLTVSAYEKHRHPSLELMSAFIPTITTPILRDPRLKEKNAHRITAYMDIDVGSKSGILILRTLSYSFETLTNTYTTRYFDGYTSLLFAYNLGLFQEARKTEGLVTSNTVINGFACWQYTIKANGDTLVGGYANLKLPLALFTDNAASTDNQEPQEVTPSSTRAKRNPQAVGKPAQLPSRFHHRLKQFR